MVVLTQDGDGGVESSLVVEQGLGGYASQRVVRIGITGVTLHSRPRPQNTVPADDAVQDETVLLNNKQDTVLQNLNLKTTPKHNRFSHRNSTLIMYHSYHSTFSMPRMK